MEGRDPVNFSQQRMFAAVAIALAAVFALAGSGSADESSRTGSRMAPVEKKKCSGAVSEHKALVRKAYKTLEDNDLDASVKLLTKDFIINRDGDGDPDPLIGRDIWRQGTEAFLAAFPDVKITITKMFGQCDMVTAVSRVDATHLGEFAGIPATGNRVIFGGTNRGETPMRLATVRKATGSVGPTIAPSATAASHGMPPTVWATTATTAAVATTRPIDSRPMPPALALISRGVAMNACQNSNGGSTTSNNRSGSISTAGRPGTSASAAPPRTSRMGSAIRSLRASSTTPATTAITTLPSTSTLTDGRIAPRYARSVRRPGSTRGVIGLPKL